MSPRVLHLLEFCDWIRHELLRRRRPPDHALGRRGEDLAHRHLQRKGYCIVARNFRARSGAGEIDIIARRGDALVFVEVKTRSSTEFGAPDEAVDAHKQRRIVRAACEYIRRTEGCWDQARFDIVSVVLGVSPAIEHLEDAFRPE